MKINCIIAIDPGKRGGIAIYIPGQKVKVAKMPEDLTELSDFFGYYAENYSPVIFLEKLSVRPDDVSVKGGGVEMGKLYRIQRMIGGYEQLKAIVGLSKIPYLLVHPMKWQAKLGIRKAGMAKEDRKRMYQKIAGELYEDVKVTLWNADALLILHFGRWALKNDLKWIKGNLPNGVFDKLF